MSDIPLTDLTVTASDKPAQSCRACAFYDLAAVLSTNGRLVRGRVARCGFPMERIKLLAAFQARHLNWRGSAMEPTDGAECATFERRQKPQTNGGAS